MNARIGGTVNTAIRPEGVMAAIPADPRHAGVSPVGAYLLAAAVTPLTNDTVETETATGPSSRAEESPHLVRPRRA